MSGESAAIFSGFCRWFVAKRVAPSNQLPPGLRACFKLRPIKPHNASRPGPPPFLWPPLRTRLVTVLRSCHKAYFTNSTWISERSIKLDAPNFESSEPRQGIAIAAGPGLSHEKGGHTAVHGNLNLGEILFFHGWRETRASSVFTRLLPSGREPYIRLPCRKCVPFCFWPSC